MDGQELGLVILIVFVSTLLRAAVGFGNALIAMPLLVLVLGPRTAAPVVALIGLGIAVQILLREWRSVDLSAAWRLVLSTAFGIPVGLVFLTSAPEGAVKMVLGSVLIGFGMYNLLGPTLPRMDQPLSSLLFGFAAGILGGAYNANGPPVVIYGALRRWEPETFRATLQGYFLVTGFIVVIGQGLAGLWTPQVLRLVIYSLPASVGAVLLGGWICRRIPEDAFDRLLYLVMVSLGVLMFF